MATWTYSGNPADSDRDAVRFLVQDTDSTRKLFFNEEIDYLLTTEHNVYMVAAVVCEFQAARQSNVKSKKIGELNINYFGPDEWKERAKQLRERGSAHQVLSAGGVYVDDRDDLEADTDLVQPYVTAGIHDNRSNPTGENEDKDG